MSNRQEQIIGYGMLTFLSVILFSPFADYMNANLPNGVIGDALASFFWLVYPILIIWLIAKTIIAFL